MLKEISREFIKEQQIEKFTKETKERLVSAGFLIQELNGKSIFDFKQEQENRRKIDYCGLYDPKKYSYLITPSLKSEVAFKTKKEGIISKNHYSDFWHNVKNVLHIKDAQVIIGNASEYIALIIDYLNATGKYLFEHSDGKSEKIATSSFVDRFSYPLGRGYGWSEEVAEYVYLVVGFHPQYNPRPGQTFLETQKKENYKISTGKECRCHPFSNKVMPLIIPQTTYTILCQNELMSRL